jgi:molecular chaperone DnaK
VTFDIDANGILHVSAKDKATGKEQKIRIEASSGLSDDEIENMVKNAEAHAEEDKTRRASIEQRNRLDALVYEVDKNSQEWADRLDDATKERLSTSVEAAKQALKTGEDAGIEKALEELSQAYSAAGASLYPTDGGTPEGEEGAAPEGEGAEEKKEEDVVEADYEIVDDSK